MSVQASAWVWKYSQARGPDFMVLHAIADSADCDGRNAWPSIATLSRMARVSESTVKRSIRRLVGLGELAVEENAGGTEKMRADRRPNRYQVIMRRRRVAAAPPPDGGSDSAPAPGLAASPQASPSPPAQEPDRGSHSTPVHAPDGGSPQPPRGVTQDGTGGHSCDPLSTQDPPKTHPTAAAAGARDPLADLADLLADHGLIGRLDKLRDTERAEVLALLATHGPAPLVAAARALHRPDQPALFASAWLPTWRRLRRPRLPTAPGPTRTTGWCSSCDHATRRIADDAGNLTRPCPDCHPDTRQRGAA